MNTIEIATAHNIVFRYELATTVQRWLACLVDFAIIVIVALIISSTFGRWMGLSTVIIVIFAAFYHLLWEMFNQGQSPGKMLVKLRVVTLKGGTPTPNDYLLRWVFRLVEIVPPTAGVVAILFISSSERNQRIGDMLAQTTVISLQNNLGISLESLSGFKQEEDILYPGVVRYDDNDMLFLKMSINRFVRYPNEENRKILKNLADRFVDDLALSGGKYNIDFLKRILSEYIILTR